MTYVIGVRCDICGQLHVAEYTGQERISLPDGWATATIHYTHIEVGPSHQRRDVCERCARALERGEVIRGSNDLPYVLGHRHTEASQ